MADGVLIDTSFLITLADSQRVNHLAARRYWRYFLENEIPVFLSTIVASEFCVRQPILPEILRACVVLPFNWDDAQHTARLHNIRWARPADCSRTALKDDVKLIAQATVADSEFIITDDTKTFYRFCEFYRGLGEIEVKPIKLEDGFDSSHFDPHHQKSLFDSSEGAEEEGSQA